MANVNITWSTSNGGAAISGNLDHGNTSNGQTTTAQEVFIRHDGSNSITDCSLYIRQFSGTYSGAASAALDIAELFSWGDQTTEAGFGGFQLNMNATSGYAGATWPTYTSKDPGSKAFTCRTGVGDSEGSGIGLLTTMGCTSGGTIQAGSSPNVRLKCRAQVPTDEDTIGVRQFDQVLVYTYTS